MATRTQPTLHQRKPNKDRRLEIRDDGARGLYLIIQKKKTGTRSWALRFRDDQGNSAKLTLGGVDVSESPAKDRPLPQVGNKALTLSDARALAGMLHRQQEDGVNLVAKYATKSKSHRKTAEGAKADSFKALAVEFFRTHKTKRSHERPRRWREDARWLGLVWKRDADPAQVEPEVLPGSLCDLWGSRPVAKITRHELENVIADAREKNIPGISARNKDESENRARKLFAVLSVLFSWLARRRHIDSDITTCIEPPSPSRTRDRILTGAELRWVWQAASQLPFPHGPITELLLLTGQRLREVGGMRRSELNEDASLWRIPGQRTKNHKEHLLPLPMMAREIINDVPKIEDRDMVFSIGGKSPPSNWEKAKRRLDATMAEIAHKERGKAVNIDHFVLHDLRRSFASGLQHLGIASAVIERVTNHISGSFAGVAGIYQRDPLLDDQRAALSAWSRYLQLVTDKSLHDAHEKFLLSGDDDERSHALKHFRDCIRAGGDRWQSYLDALTGEKPPKLADLTNERRRRSK
jgi:integrase